MFVHIRTLGIDNQIQENNKHGVSSIYMIISACRGTDRLVPRNIVGYYISASGTGVPTAYMLL